MLTIERNCKESVHVIVLKRYRDQRYVLLDFAGEDEDEDGLDDDLDDEENEVDENDDEDNDDDDDDEDDDDDDEDADDETGLEYLQRDNLQVGGYCL